MARARTNKRGSLGHQINQRMIKMERFGESRYEAKKDYNANIENNKQGKTVGMHSYGTFGTYKSSCKQFVKWAKETEQGIKNIEDVKEEHIRDYIKYREEAGYSAYTYSKDISALNKVFGTDVHKKDCDVANRSYKDVTNNREMKEHHKHINYNNYSDEIKVAQSSGMRRESLEKVSANSFNYDSNGYPIQIRLRDERADGGRNMEEKNGRPRESDIPYHMRAEIKELIQNRLDENGGDRDKPLFDHVPTRLGTHRLRQEYADTMYKQYIEEHGAGTMKLKDTGKSQFENNENTEFRGYDVGALKYASESLGHNRLDVVVYSYLNKLN